MGLAVDALVICAALTVEWLAFASGPCELSASDGPFLHECVEASPLVPMPLSPLGTIVR
jgi:hypothetical protein